MVHTREVRLDLSKTARIDDEELEVVSSVEPGHPTRLRS